MSDNNNPSVVEIELIEQMANSLVGTSKTQTRNIFIDWAMNYLQDNGTNSLSDALGKNADKYISLLNIKDIINDSTNFAHACIQYAGMPSAQKASQGAKIFQEFFTVTSDIVGYIDFEPIMGTYISMVLEIASFSLDKVYKFDPVIIIGN